MLAALISILLYCSFSANAQPLPGAESFNEYLPLLKGKRVALAVNQTAVTSKGHLADALIAAGISPVKIMVPEHGFRGDKDAGEHVNSDKDPGTGIPLISLYGNNKKPTAEQLRDVDVVVFDMQDVGVRFYTYISTMHYIMEACAEHKKPLLILDRPNPNGMYIDGPVLDAAYKSFVGMHPIPVLHGCTVGELAQMINREKWLAKGMKCELTVIKCKNYAHTDNYILPVNPSPNLRDSKAIRWYASTCFFEGTPVSVGRGTANPFLYIGFPGNTAGTFSFTPIAGEGSKNPPHQNKLCSGDDLTKRTPVYPLDLTYLIKYYHSYPEPDKYFIPFFQKLAGNNILEQQIKSGVSQTEIRKSWEPSLIAYKKMRKQYLLYPDFE